MKEEAEQHAKEEREKLLKKARAEGEEIIEKAQRTKEDMRKSLEKEAEIKVMDFTVLLLGEILSANTSDMINESIISDFLNDLEEVDMEMITEDTTSAEVTVSGPLADKLKNRLSEILKKKLNREILLNIEEDKKIISGMVLKFGSLSLNGSLKYLLEDKGTEVKEKLERGLL